MNGGNELNPQQFRRSLASGLAFPLLGALLIAIILLVEVIYLVRVQRWVEQTDRVIEQADAAEKLLVDQERALRDYLLSGKRELLEPYESAAPRTMPALAALEAGVSDDPAQLARVRQTRAHYADWSQLASDVLAQHGGGQNLAARIPDPRGKQRMDAMRAELDAIVEHERAARARRVAVSSVAAWIVIISAGVLTMLGGLLVALVTRRQLISIAASYRESLALIGRQHDDLRQSQDRYRSLVELSPEGIIVVAADGTLSYANPAFVAMLGYADASQLVGKDALGVLHPAYRDHVRARMRIPLDERRNVPLEEQRMLRADGSEIWVESAAGPFDVDSQVAVQVVIRDITSRKQIEEALRRSETTLARAQAIAHLGSWELDVPSGAVKWSNEMYRIFGQDPLKFHPTREAIEPLVHPDDRDAVLRAADETIAHDVPFDVDHRIVRPNGIVRYVNSQGQVMRDPSGTALRFIGTMLDITERKLAEEELRQLNETLEQRVQQRTAELRQALDDVGAFSYTISHDLRAPLRNIQGLARELLDRAGGKLDEAATEHGRRIVAAAARMDRLTQEVLEYSRLSRRELAPQRVSVVLVLHEVLGQLQRDPGFARAHVAIREPMPWVLAHRATLATVVSNLLTNAAQFVAADVTPVISVWSERRDDTAVIWFQDNGVGIAPEDQARIFDVFERIHPPGPAADGDRNGGSGLGLAIVRRGIERMGGRVGVQSTPGQGSRFWIELPIDPHSP